MFIIYLECPIFISSRVLFLLCKVNNSSTGRMHETSYCCSKSYNDLLALMHTLNKKKHLQ